MPTGTLSARHSANDRQAFDLAQQAFDTSSLSVIDKLDAFPRFTTKRSIARFLAKTELFKRVINVNGSIVECGVFNGAGLFTWAHMSNIYEPANHSRKIIGFDTFEGFPSIDDRDNTGVLKSKEGDLRGSTLDQLQISVKKSNAERHLSHIENIFLVQGDFMNTAEAYLDQNRHLLISLLYLDFDLFEPTKRALELFLPRMPKGAIVAFDELNCDSFPGETLAFLDSIDIRAARLERSPIDPWISFLEL
jgi:hypothetical protein